MAYERGGDVLEDAREILNREAIGPRQSRFSIGSAPLTSITKSDAQISGGGSLVRSPVPAFRFTGVIPLLWPRLSHSTPDTQFREGSSLQAGLYARTPRSVRLLRLIR